MILLANFISGLAGVIKILLDIMLLLVLARAVISWINIDPYNPIVRFLSNTTDPILYWLRRRMPWLVQGGMDFAPILIVVAIVFLQSFLVQSLLEYSVEIKRNNAYSQVHSISE